MRTRCPAPGRRLGIGYSPARDRPPLGQGWRLSGLSPRWRGWERMGGMDDDLDFMLRQLLNELETANATAKKQAASLQRIEEAVEYLTKAVENKDGSQ